MSYSLNSIQGQYIGDFIRLFKEDAMSLDYSSYDPFIISVLSLELLRLSLKWILRCKVSSLE